MKKALYVIADILIAAFLAGAYIIQYFARQKLGMIRWINFHVMKAREAMPIDALRYIAVAVVWVFVIFLLVRYSRKRGEYKRIVGCMVIVSAVLAVLYLSVTIAPPFAAMQGYYLILPLAGIANVVQLVKVFAAMRVCKK